MIMMTLDSGDDGNSDGDDDGGDYIDGDDTDNDDDYDSNHACMVVMRMIVDIFQSMVVRKTMLYHGICFKKKILETKLLVPFYFLEPRKRFEIPLPITESFTSLQEYLNFMGK